MENRRPREVFIPSRARPKMPSRATSFSYDAHGNLLQKTINGLGHPQLVLRL